ncbi:MAG: cupin, partial [Mesorhizobium sp.]
RHCVSASNFLVVGAYPPSGPHNECRTAAQAAKAVVTIPSVGRPRKDPVYGSIGPLLAAWKRD